RSRTFGAGASHGCSATQTGVIGPRVTIPVRVPGGGVACAPAARARAMLESTTTTRIGITNGRCKKEGRPCGRPSRLSSLTPELRGELADERGPVGERRPATGAVTRAPARTKQVVAGPAHEERAAPRRVVARGADVLAGDPDRVTVDRGRA